VRALEKEDWLKVLNPHWTVAKVDTNGLAQLMKTRQQMVDLGYTVDPSAGVMYFLTSRLSDKDISDLRRQIPRKDLVDAWRDIEDHAKQLAKRLTGKEAATPSRTWNLLSSSRMDMVLFLAVTARQQAVAQKIKNFLTKWRDVQKKIPLPEMTELLITPQLPEYPKIARDVFMLLLDGKLRSRTETLKFLKPFAPPPPPPPPPPRRGRGKAAAAPPVVAAPAKGVKGKAKAAAVAAALPTPPAQPAKVAAQAKPEAKAKTVTALQVPKVKGKPSASKGKPPKRPAKPSPKRLSGKKPSAKKSSGKKAKSKKR
jgi:tRNA nucleotidyltransferase (CCA-adding enzyme)